LVSDSFALQFIYYIVCEKISKQGVGLRRDKVDVVNGELSIVNMLRVYHSRLMIHHSRFTGKRLLQ
jgi:hypothetical protein